MLSNILLQSTNEQMEILSLTGTRNLMAVCPETGGITVVGQTNQPLVYPSNNN